MKRLYTAMLAVITLLTLTVYVSADGPVGADCTTPPNLVPFADLVNCDLSGREMEGVDLSNANLSGANLDNANLFTSILRAATFDNASLRNTLMEDADARDASFIGADLRGADLYFARFHNANLTGANLSNTWLISIDFPGAIMQNANLSGSDVRFMDFRGTDLSGADLSFSRLLYVSASDANFSNATLLGAKLLGGNPLIDANWGNTTCPDGSDSDDDDGDYFTCESNFPENVPPTITLTSPAPDTTVPRGETIHISADAADSDGTVIRVEFYAGDTLLVHDGTVPYSFDWTDADGGSHVISAKAYDENGGVTTSESATVHVLPSPNNEPPTVTITSPKKNATIYRLWGTTISANANDPDGNVTKVEFYVDGTLLNTDTSVPYSYYWKPSSKGNQTLTATAYDSDGAVTTSTPVTVRVR